MQYIIYRYNIKVIKVNIFNTTHLLSLTGRGDEKQNEPLGQLQVTNSERQGVATLCGPSSPHRVLASLQKKKEAVAGFGAEDRCDLTSILTGPLWRGDYSGGQRNSQGSGDGA